MKKHYLAGWVFCLSLGFAPYAYAVVEWNPVTVFPNLSSILAIDLNADNALPPAEILGGEDGFLAKELTDSTVFVDGKENTTFVSGDKTYMVLSNVDQLRVMDANRDGKIDFYDPAFFKLVIVVYKPDQGLIPQKLSNAKIVAINVPAKPATGFAVQEISGHALKTLEGQMVKLPPQ